MDEIFALMGYGEDDGGENRPTAAAKSSLSDPRYGYDVVVATTQASINATMKGFLSKLREPVVTMCFVADERENATPIEYTRLVDETGIDPFNIPVDADPSSHPELQRLYERGFMAGFRARLGLPPGYRPTQIPDLVVLGSDTSAVTFNMLCSQFDIVELKPGRRGPIWNRQSQPAAKAWLIQSRVDLRLSAVEPNAYQTLPPAMQATIKNLSEDAFSVRQLVFDLSNAQLAATLPEIEGVDPTSDAYILLTKYFIGGYFNELRREGEPMLGAAITHNAAPDQASLSLTDLTFHVGPFVGDDGQALPDPTAEQQSLATLNYLCAVNNNRLPPTVAFTWNWLNPEEKSDSHGVAVTSRAAYVAYLNHHLIDHARRNCIRPKVHVTLEGFLDTEVVFGFQASKPNDPAITTPATGATLLSYAFESEDDDEAGVGGALGSLAIKTTYHMAVTVSGNTMTITQRQTAYMDASGGPIEDDGTIIDKTITDTYTLTIDSEGHLQATPAYGAPTDNSENLNMGFVDTLFNGGQMQDISDKLTQALRDFTSPSFQPVPLNVVQDYIFPGGKTFAFKSVGFSDNQDLVAHITYTDPE